MSNFLQLLTSPVGIVIILGGILAIVLFLSLLFRVVVPTNEVHIVQRKKKAVPHGRDLSGGNVYYNWPSWLPVIGITRLVMPLSIFDITLDNYQAYDNGKVPFGVDIKAFFRVSDAEMAAERVEDFDELQGQLVDILKGAIRKILASEDVIVIMEGRGAFGKMFTEEVASQLKDWGVTTVKNIELMDIRDGTGSTVITDIMEKKKSAIEKESRIEVANNKRDAEIAEITAKRDADLEEQDSQRQVGEKTAEKEKMVGIAQEIALQEIKEQARVTADKQMEVQRVEDVKAADIAKEVQIVKANELKQTSIIEADGRKSEIEILAEAQRIQTEKVAEGDKNAELLRAQGIESVGKAEAEAKRLLELAPVSAQIELAKEIGANPAYMEYLLGIDGIKAGKIVGIEKAKALQTGDLKVIANGQGDGSVNGGVDSILDLFSGAGGTQLGTMLETLKNTPAGEELRHKLMTKKQQTTTSTDTQPPLTPDTDAS